MGLLSGGYCDIPLKGGNRVETRKPATREAGPPHGCVQPWSVACADRTAPSARETGSSSREVGGALLQLICAHERSQALVLTAVWTEGLQERNAAWLSLSVPLRGRHHENPARAPKKHQLPRVVVSAG